MSQKLERKYGLFTAVCMVAGIVIGSGVFFKAQTILQLTGGDMPTGILAWIIGGVIMLACLLTFSFMGQKYERVNGVVDYAEATVGPGYGYYMGWFVGTIYFPAMSAVLAWLSARYTLEFLVSVNPSLPLLIPASQGGCVVGPECIALALFYMCAIFGMNTLAPKLAGKFQTTTTVIKLIPLGLMAVVGILYGLSTGMLHRNMQVAATVENISDNPLFAAVCATSFAYEGWIIATSINSEIRNSKRNLPKALIIGGIIIVATYLLYFVGVAGGATNQELVDVGAPLAFTNIFGNVLGNVLNLFIAISCLGTANGLMLGCTRCMYSLAARNKGPRPAMFAQVDPQTKMAGNSAVFALMASAAWFLYFYLANLAGSFGNSIFAFDSSELPIVTVYTMYFPIFLRWMIREKDQPFHRRFLLPCLAMCGSGFMVLACILSHKEKCIGYLIVFAVIMLIGCLFRGKKATQ